jgi:hypothetical protein
MGRLGRPLQSQFGGDVIGVRAFGELDESPQQSSWQAQFVSEGATHREILIERGSQRAHDAPLIHGKAMPRSALISTLA